jgi:copper(I)-binding protein
MNLFFKPALVVAIGLGLLLSLHGCSESRKGLTVSPAKLPAVPPGSKVMAGYLTIHNYDTRDHKLIKVSSKSFSSVEIHKSVIEKGVASMQRKESLLIKKNTSLHLKPGSYHLMLFNPEKDFKVGDKIRLDLTFQNHTTVIIKATVVNATSLHKH